MLLRSEKIEERLPDLSGRHHLKRIGTITKIRAACEWKFFAKTAVILSKEKPYAGDGGVTCLSSDCHKI
jgi:hypothetical protein